MVTYERAREAALSRMTDKKWFNLCTEYDHAFVFSKYDNFSFGGQGSPCAVMKQSGECLNFSSVLDEIGDEISCWLMGPDGGLTPVDDAELERLQDSALSELGD